MSEGTGGDAAPGWSEPAQPAQSQPAQSQPAQSQPARRTSAGPGRVLIVVYAFFALSAGARAGWQIATRFGDAPVAYLLSALAAGIYLVAAAALARSGPTARRVAVVSCGIELAGVLVVGTLSLLLTDVFPRATVWSAYGVGYGLIPLVLPILGLLWLRHTRPLR